MPRSSALSAQPQSCHETSNYYDRLHRQKGVVARMPKYFLRVASQPNAILTIRKNTHTIVWAIFTPRDGIDAEQAGSSPSALHSTVVASEGGLACCQYSTPVQ